MVLAIGVYDADALPSRWSYWAELQTPLEILKERDEKRRLLDLAILRIRGTLVLQPAVFTGTSTRYQVHREGDEAPPQFSDTLRLGRPADVTSGSPLIVLGWPSPDGQTSIFVDTTHECLAREGTIIRTRAFIHAGSSGGPALNSSLQALSLSLSLSLSLTLTLTLTLTLSLTPHRAQLGAAGGQRRLAQPQA